MTVDFITFCYSGDIAKVHHEGHLANQVRSNNYPFENVYLVYQNCTHYEPSLNNIFFHHSSIYISDIDDSLKRFGIKLNNQFESETDTHHFWKYHVVNHVVGANNSTSEYIVFADNDCWMIKQPHNISWVDVGMNILHNDKSIFIVSPNDGEPERTTRRMSQQMFLVRRDDFLNADLNQPGWDGNTNVPGGPMPEYWSMLEGRMELWCRQSGKFRYVLPPEFRYWHHNKLNVYTGYYETDLLAY